MTTSLGVMLQAAIIRRDSLRKTIGVGANSLL